MTMVHWWSVRCATVRKLEVKTGVLSALLVLLCLPVSRVFAAGWVGAALPADPPPDTVILTNGDQINGQFVRAVGGTVTFHSAIIGDLHLDWSKIQSLRTSTTVSVILRGMILNEHTSPSSIPSGVLRVQSDTVTLLSDSTGTIATFPEASVAYIVDRVTLDKELRGTPGFFAAWNGAVTAGASLVRATQDAYNVDGAISLVRTVPTASWLAPRNRTTLLLNGTSGRITQPAYVTSGGTSVPAQVTRTDIFHAGVERDQYFSASGYYLGTVQYDHNYAQNLQLQQLYGAGLGWTVLRTPAQTLDLTVNIQYVKQTFIDAAPGDNQNLVGSTISANYVTQLTPEISFTQYAAVLPAFNAGEAYSMTERNTLTLPAYRGIRVLVGTTDTYLNSVPPSEPPSQRNSFQLTFGLSYDVTSSY